MIKSMTGFGQATGGKPALGFTVEIRSWNHRFFEFSTRLPSVLVELEDKIRDLVYSRVKRGKITLLVSFKKEPDEWEQLALDEKKIDFYVRSMKNVQKKYKLSDSISINTLFTIPNLFLADRNPRQVSTYWPALKSIIEKALSQLEEAKAKEGEALKKDIAKRADAILDALTHIEKVAKTLPEERKKQLFEKVRALTEGLELDEGRLEREAAVMAERSDVTEEIVRAKHHLSTVHKTLSADGEAGKKLDFIAQELNREINTIGSKAQQMKIQDEVIRVKGELEKIREQIQNIE